MRQLSRLLLIVVILIGLMVGARQLAAQDTALGEVLLTGAYVIGGLAILFASLVGLGKGLGALVNRGRSSGE